MLLRILLVTCLCAMAPRPALATEATEAPDLPRYGFRWIPPSGFYGDWVYLLAGYYSGLDGFGAGFEISRPFQFGILERYSVSDVELRFKARAYEGLHGMFEARADANLAGGHWGVRGLFSHSTRLREFWGVGPNVPDSDRERYRPRDARAYFELLRNIERLRIGLRVEWQNYQYRERESDGLLESGAYPGVSEAGESVVGLGLAWEYDSRDDRYAPTRGWRLQGNFMGFEAFRSGPSGFLSGFFDAATYISTSPANVFAFQGFLFSVNGEPPLWRYAAIGGREHTRGYSRNRYLDQKMTAIQGEWRRRLYRQLGLQVFLGSAVIGRAWSKLQIRHQHPTLGAGLSIVIPQVSNVAIRGDLAVGDESVHGRLKLGLAF